MLNPKYIIGICGASCSGKTTVCNKIMETITQTFGSKKICVINQDSFYFGGDHDTNYDVPSSIDFNKMKKVIKDLKNGKATYGPLYDFSTHSRLKEQKLYESTDIILVEGNLIFFDPKIRNLCQTRIYISALPELKYERRLMRDIKERGRKVEDVKKRYMRDVLPSFYQYVDPLKNFCHIELVNNEDNNFIGMEILLDHITIKCVKCFNNINFRDV